MRKKLLGSASALSLAGALAVTATPAHAAAPQAASPRVTSTSAPAAAPQEASGWVPVYLHAEYGNGCADYLADLRLEPIVSEPCSESNWWYYRDLSNSSGQIDPGDELEFVDAGMQYALGYSGGLLKLETPNDDTTYLYEGPDSPQVKSNSYEQELLTPQDEYAEISPNGAGDDLQLAPYVVNNSGDDAWTECAVTNLGMGACNYGAENTNGVVVWPLTP
jgi:hypothetical protein